VAFNFQNGKTNIKLLKEYESVTQKILFGNAVPATLMSVRKYGIIHQNGHCSRERICVFWFFETKSDIKMQRCYRTQYGKNSPSDMLYDFA
jgi:hypothetical protein